MGDDNKIHLHRVRKFVKGRSLKYKGGSCRIIELVDVYVFSFFELKGIAKEEIEYDGVLDFFYVTPNCTLDSGLRRLFIDDDSINLMKYGMGKREIHV